ncbi:hypothetical protein ACSS6W_002736 [Trichoderma asperelloides]
MGGDDTAAVYITSAQLSRIGASCCASVQTQRTLYAALRLVFAIKSPFCPIAYSASSSHVSYLISSYGLAFKAATLHFYFQVPKIRAS